MKKFLLPIAVVCLAAGMTYAQDPMRTTALNIFKNGTYFIVKEGSLPLNNSKAQLQIPKAPLLGTFWMTTSKDLAINRVLFSTDTIKTTRQAKTLIDLIQSNKGKKVKLLYRVDEKTTTEISGTLLDYISMSGIVKIKTNDGKYAISPHPISGSSSWRKTQTKASKPTRHLTWRPSNSTGIQKRPG